MCQSARLKLFQLDVNNDIVVSIMASSVDSCVKCNTIYQKKTKRDQDWQWDCTKKVWYCPACTREAARDGQKEFRSLLNTFGSAVQETTGIYHIVKRTRTEEYWTSLMCQGSFDDFNTHDAGKPDDSMDCCD